MIRLTVEDLVDLRACGHGIVAFADDYPSGATPDDVIYRTKDAEWLLRELSEKGPVWYEYLYCKGVLSERHWRNWHVLGSEHIALLRKALWSVWPYDGTER